MILVLPASTPSTTVSVQISTSTSDARRLALSGDLIGRLCDAPPAIRDDVGLVGVRVISDTDPPPHALNLTYAEDGTALFTIFGSNGREAELWVGEGPHVIAYVLSGPGADMREGRLPIREYNRIARWLRGDADRI